MPLWSETESAVEGPRLRSLDHMLWTRREYGLLWRRRLQAVCVGYASELFCTMLHQQMVNHKFTMDHGPGGGGIQNSHKRG